MKKKWADHEQLLIAVFFMFSWAIFFFEYGSVHNEIIFFIFFASK
jgi:hypothetical protein